MTTEYPRGSEWRKCDLHIHTPFSKNTEYGDKEDKSTWDTFIKDIVTTIQSCLETWSKIKGK